MRIVLLFTCCLLFTGMVAKAQKKKAYWFTQPTVTLLNGDKYTSVAITAVTGVQLGRWSIGAGTGIDYYKVRTVPILAELRYETKLKTSPFVYARYGYNVAWALDHQHTKLYGYYTLNSVYNNGSYAAVGTGCYLYRKGKEGVVLGLGYSTKGLTELYNESVWTGNQSVMIQRKLDYVFRRLDISLAYRF